MTHIHRGHVVAGVVGMARGCPLWQRPWAARGEQSAPVNARQYGASNVREDNGITGYCLQVG